MGDGFFLYEDRLARLSASGANLQPLKYFISNDAENNALIFPSLAWAGYLKDWAGPVQGERPAAYIILLGDTEISSTFSIDMGIAAQSITLGITAHGFGACMISSARAIRDLTCHCLGQARGEGAA